MLLKGDKAHSELSNGGFGLKIGPYYFDRDTAIFCENSNTFYMNCHNSAKNSPVFNLKPPLESLITS